MNGAPTAGRPARLGKEQVALVENELLHRAAANGYDTDLWTLPRVAELIKRIVGVRYEPAHVWMILHMIGWSMQRPTLRARERDEQKVQKWTRGRWKEVNKTPNGGTHG
jgi:transposase